MSEARSLSIFHIVLGVLLIATGIAVFAIRLQHDGTYAMPHGGPLLGAIGVLVLGGILLWKGKPRVLGWIAILISPVALFPSIYSIMGEWEEVVSLYAKDADGQVVDLRLWIVDRDDGEWVGMPRDKALHFKLHGSELELLRAGEKRCVVPMMAEDFSTVREIHTMKVEKYAVAQLAGSIGMYPLEATESTAALRLDPC